MDSKDKSTKKAHQYLLDAGTPLLKGYVNVLCELSSPSSLALWIEKRIPEFSFSETVASLEVLDSLAYQDCSAGELAVAQLVKCQREDGGWGEHTLSLDCLSVTGQVAGLLAKSPFSPGRSLRAAESYLTKHWSEARVRAGSMVDIDVYFHWYANYPGDLADEALQWCGRELTRGFRSDKFGPLAVGRVFVRCGARALPATPISSSEVCEKLLETQRSDGSFSDSHVGSEIESTGVALNILANLG